MRYVSTLVVASTLMLLPAAIAAAQTSANPADIGLQQYHDYHGGQIDHINMDNGSLSLTIPLVSYPQRGNVLKLDFEVTYSGGPNSFQRYCSDDFCSDTWNPVPNPVGNAIGGLQFTDTQSVYEENFLEVLAQPGGGNDYNGGDVQVYIYQPYWSDYTGASHPGWQTSTGAISLDGSNFQTNVTTPLSSESYTCHWACTLPSFITSPSPLVTTHDGITYISHSPTSSDPSVYYPVYRMDPDGNYIVQAFSGYTDTVGRSIPVVSMNSTPTAAQIQNAGCTGPLSVTTLGTWSAPGYATPFYFCYVTVPLSATNYSEWDNEQYVYSWTQQALQSIVLPNGQSWVFEYNASPTGCEYEVTNVGDLSKITFPTGGSIAYGYKCLQDPFSLTWTTAVASRSVDANDGAGTHVWTYDYSPNYSSNTANPNTTILTDPLGNQTVQTLNLNTGGTQNATRVIQYYAGSSSTGQLLRTNTRTYSMAYSQYNETFPLNPFSETDVFASGNSTTKQYQYCCDISFTNPWLYTPQQQAASYGKLTDVKAYDFSGALLSDTSTSYLFQSSSAYLNLGLFDELTSKNVTNGANVSSSVTYGYDETGRVASGISAQSNSQWSSQTPYSVWGHRTSQTNVLNTSASNPKTTTTYYDTGEVATQTDPRLNTAAQYQYSAAYLYSLPTTVTDAGGWSDTMAYRLDTGQLISTTDPNNATTSYTTTADPLNRITKISYPDAGETDITYNDTGQIGVTVTKQVAPDPNETTQYIVDGLGRDRESISSDPFGVIYTHSTYDALGRKYQVWNPTRCDPTSTTCQEATWGLTTYGYDALSRATSVLYPDGSLQQWCYDNLATNGQTNCHPNMSGATGEWVDISDGNGSDWQRETDALGRLIDVVEPNASSRTPVMITSYGYDAVGNLLSVSQNGKSGDSRRIRTFTYDSLSRLICASNPEMSSAQCPATATASYTSGTTQYVYDANGNVTAKTSPAVNITDGSQTIGYCYDELNRMTYKFYSGTFNCTNPSNFSATYTYDGSSVSGKRNTIRRLTDEKSYVGATLVSERQLYAYDAMGRLLNENQCLLGNCSALVFHPAFTSDAAGNRKTSTDGTTQNPMSSSDPLTFSSSYDSGGRLATITTNWADTAHPGTLFTAQGYTAASTLSSWLLGTNLYTLRNYDHRLRVCSQASAAGQTPTAAQCGQ
jgi:YD repeat-containing protein